MSPETSKRAGWPITPPPRHEATGAGSLPVGESTAICGDREITMIQPLVVKIEPEPGGPGPSVHLSISTSRASRRSAMYGRRDGVAGSRSSGAEGWVRFKARFRVLENHPWQPCTLCQADIFGQDLTKQLPPTPLAPAADCGTSPILVPRSFNFKAQHHNSTVHTRIRTHRFIPSHHPS